MLQTFLRFFTPLRYDARMSALHQQRSLRLPYRAAREALHAKLAPLAASARSARIELRAPLVAVKATHDVEAVFELSEDPLRFDEVWKVCWHPYGGGPYPDFEGTLAIRSRDGGRCTLELDGNYEPPLGQFGRVFDAVLGARIASATARELLADLAEEIEERTVTNQAS